MEKKKKAKKGCPFCKEPPEIFTLTCGWCGALKTFVLVQVDALPESDTTQLMIPVEVAELEVIR